MTEFQKFFLGLKEDVSVVSKISKMNDSIWTNQWTIKNRYFQYVFSLFIRSQKVTNVKLFSSFQFEIDVS